ncbi:MAG: hypothetical protein HY320_03565 [Armatimonadetes bacterium]|nr:hypothetical protein [Armatimonadota bacterium]
MSGHGAKLPRKREQAIAALLAEPTVGAAAGAAGVGYATLRRWLALPEFDAEYRAARLEAVERMLAETPAPAKNGRAGW